MEEGEKRGNRVGSQRQSEIALLELCKMLESLESQSWSAPRQIFVVRDQDRSNYFVDMDVHWNR